MTTESLKKVMCVNDNDITLFIFKRTLSKSNFSEKIITRTDGLEAFRYCKQLISNPDEMYDLYPRVIFLDLHMPVMDGWEFLDKFSNEIWPHFQETKIIITSQSVDEEDAFRAREYPFVVDFHGAPITTAYLDKLYDRLLESFSFQH